MGEPMPRRGHRIDELNGVARWAVIVAVAGFAVVPFTSAAIALAQGWQPTGDVAVIGLRSRDVAGAEIPLLGQTSTAEELTGTPANHPGPIEYWVLAASTAVAAARTATILALTRFVDRQVAAVQRLAVQLADRLVRRLVVSDFDEAEAARLARVAVRDDAHGLGAVGREKGAERLLVRGIAQLTDKNSQLGSPVR